MLGIFHLLPFLKGWEYKVHKLERTVVRGASPIEYPINETGWLMLLDLLTDDAYGTVSIEFQGADLETRTIIANVETGKALGGVMQDPSGWIQRYFRPNPYSTAGIFYGCIFSGGFQGTTLPYVPTVKMKIYLPEESTQASAYISAGAQTIAITDKKAFLISLRKMLGIKGKLDLKMLALGPVPLVEEEE